MNLTFWAVIMTALIDSINPCAIGVLILLVSTLMSLAKNRMKMLMVGSIYIAAVYVTYLLAGVGLLLFIQRFALAEPIGIVVGVLVVLAGLLEIKDFFWYGLGFSLAIPVVASKGLARMAKRVTIPGAIVLGVFVAAVELPCTGGPYLAITALLAQNFNMLAMWYLVIYNFIFVLPLIVIVGVAYLGANMSVVHSWKEDNKKWMRLATGFLMMGLGVLLILFATGTISLGHY